MKQKIILLLIAATLFTFVSCLSTDDNTPTNYSTEYRQAVGQYTGTMYALDNITALSADTLAHPVNAVISADSLISFSDFPLHFIAKEISDVKLREAIEARGNTTLKVKFKIFSRTDDNVFCYLAPQTVYLNNVEYNGASHEVAISFIYPTEGFFISNKYIQIPMYVGGVYVDEVIREDLSSKLATHLILQFQGNKN
ncbi:MAG: DUF4840 domain-containing protein [Bacteroidaceae bacterium]|nr:DUF4840 domain-containing protein [Prevotella sp.]MBR0273712.1 DUF4840 domain-containing protein [Bacteroidaceae bacterium]